MRITEELIVIDTVSILIIVILVIIIISSSEYYRQIRKAQKEYQKSKNIIEDIVVSFNRELKRKATKIEVIGYKVNSILAKSDSRINQVKLLEKNMVPFKEHLLKFDKEKEDYESKTSNLEIRIQNMDDINQRLKKRVETIEAKLIRLTEMPEIQRDSVIPIRREKAMSAITETEIKVLELLTNEGGKTAPEIKNRINLSREHTARLMKKLYEKGYLERETGKIPYIYKIKKEMENILNSTNNSSS
jgi:hypothetical protein